jgi:hypothetical protein
MKPVYIVTITDGNINSLELTFSSIDEQDVHSYKNVVISKKSLENLNNKFKTKRRIFIYKKNSSIYEAMNYGLKRSKNNTVMFLNAGDIFFSKSSLKTIFQYSKKYKFKVCLMFISILKNSKDYFIPRKKEFFGSSFLTHSSFIRPPEKNDSGFNNEKKITADGEWMKNNVKKFNIKKIYIPLSIFYLGGISNLPSKRSLMMKTNNGSYTMLKEFLKLMLLKIVGINLFYKIIYYFKYVRINHNKICQLHKKNLSRINKYEKF